MYVRRPPMDCYTIYIASSRQLVGWPLVLKNIIIISSLNSKQTVFPGRFELLSFRYIMVIRRESTNGRKRS